MACENSPLFRVVDENRKNVWVYLRGRLVAWNNRPGHHIGFLVDGTPFGSVLIALKDSLERYETILNDAEILLGEMDLEGNMTFGLIAGSILVLVVIPCMYLILVISGQPKKYPHTTAGS